MNKRFYPPWIPEHEHEPTADDFDVVHTQGFGYGVVAKRAFKEGEIVARFGGTILHHQTLYTLQIEPGLYIEDPWWMGRVLHSCEPNMLADMRAQTFTAVRDIPAGSFATMDYESTEDELYRAFQCRCGADNCRGLIQGRSLLLSPLKLVGGL